MLLLLFKWHLYNDISSFWCFHEVLQKILVIKTQKKHTKLLSWLPMITVKVTASVLFKPFVVFSASVDLHFFMVMINLPKTGTRFCFALLSALSLLCLLSLFFLVIERKEKGKHEKQTMNSFLVMMRRLREEKFVSLYWNPLFLKVNVLTYLHLCLHLCLPLPLSLCLHFSSHFLLVSLMINTQSKLLYHWTIKNCHS